MPRKGLTAAKVVDAAFEVADQTGLDQLTMAAVAARLNVRLPSLYKHIDGLPALRRQMAVRAKLDLADLIIRSSAGLSGRSALQALAEGYLIWGHRHPAAYAASLVAPALGDEADLDASSEAAQAVYAVLRGYRLDEATMIDAVRTIRALLHGYTGLTLAGGFGLDRSVDSSLSWALDGLHAWLMRHHKEL